MTKQVEIYYYLEDTTRTIFWSDVFQEDRPDLIFIDSSFNPNKKMAVAKFTRNGLIRSGYKIKEMP